MNFFPGLHQPCDAQHFDRAFISVNRLRDRKADFVVNDWIMDSGAFSTIATHGYYPEEPQVYAAQIKRWSRCGNLLAAAAQDFMCEDEQLIRTGAGLRHGVAIHQGFTVSRYIDLRMAMDAINCPTYILPVLQGRTIGDYIRHIKMYEELGYLPHGAWVGVGSVCKRNAEVTSIWMVLSEILDYRPDLKLHGFGVKTTSLQEWRINELLHTADSMAWSYAARREGRNQNDWREAKAFGDRMTQYINASA